MWVDNTDLAGDGGTPTLQAVDAAHPIFLVLRSIPKIRLTSLTRLWGRAQPRFTTLLMSATAP